MEEPIGAGDAASWREQSALSRAQMQKNASQNEQRLRGILDEIKQRHADVLQGREPTADALEDAYGKLDEVPSWRNAEDLAKANEGKSWWDTSAKWTLAPQRYDYMQDVGRDVDLLRSVESGVQADDAIGGHTGRENAVHAALKYWDRSKGADSTDDIWGPRYQRFAGLSNQIESGYIDPAVSLSAALHRMDDIPGILRDLLAGRGAAESLERSNAMGAFNRRYRLGKNPVLDLPSDEPAQDVDSYMRQQDEYQQRHNDLEGKYLALQPARGQEVANGASQAMFGSNAPALAGDAVDVLTSIVDPSFIASAAVAAPAIGMAKAAARSRAASGLVSKGFRDRIALLNRREDLLRSYAARAATGARSAAQGVAGDEALKNLAAASRYAAAADRAAREAANAQLQWHRAVAPTVSRGDLAAGFGLAARRDAAVDTAVSTALGGALGAGNPRSWFEYAAAPADTPDQYEDAAARDDERQRAILWMNGQLGTPDVRTGRGVFDPIGSMFGR